MTDARKIRVILADDHEMMRAGLRRLLEDTAELVIVAEAETGEQAVQQFFKHRPDLLILDLSMPGIGGLEGIRRILKRDSAARILVLSMHEDTIYSMRAIQAGAMGYLSKRTAPHALLRAVRAIAAGEVFLERDIAQRIALHTIGGSKDPLHELTDREFEVFRMLAEGQPVAKVAESLFLSPKTVGTYQTHIMQKLCVNNSAELARLAIRKGIIQP
jgi:two-component system invasion response regulator UvrY